MKIKLQERVPYQNALKWTIHRDYYLNQGAQVFLDQEVPYNVSSNARAAYQNARLVFAALQAKEREPQEPIYILELGAGLGLFAMHFIQAFETLCQQEQVDYDQYLSYWITDFSDKTLHTVAENPHFQRYQAQGRLSFYTLDVQHPETAQALSGETIQLDQYRFAAIIANYQHSTLPVAVLLHQNGAFYEKQTESYYWLAGSPEQPPNEAELQELADQLATQLQQFDFLKAIADDHPRRPIFQALQQSLQQLIQVLQQEGLAQWSEEEDLKNGLMAQLYAAWIEHLPELYQAPDQKDQLQQTLQTAIISPLFAFESYEPERFEEISSYQEIDLESYVTDAAERAAVQAVAAHYPLATIPYPYASFQALRSLFSGLEPQGIILISDKGYWDKSCMLGIYEEDPTTHGSTLAHAVNFPLLAGFAEQMQWASLRTSDETFPLHTLLLTHKQSLADWLKPLFTDLFMTHNANDDSHAFLEAGQLFMKAEQLPQAINYYLKALKSRPQDAAILYFLSVCYLNLGNFPRALVYLEQPNDDYYGVFNFALLIAEAKRSLHQFAAAIPYYQEAMKRFGENSLIYYNLGLCWQELGEQEQAHAAYQRAHELDDSDTDICEALAEVSALL